MPTYKYIAVNSQKEKYKGIFIADDESDLAIQLTKQGLYLVSASIYKSGTPSAFFTFGVGKGRSEELTLFCRQFSIMISTGIPLLKCVDCLKQQPYSSYFRSVLQVISEDIKGGAMLSEALGKHKRIFPDFFLSMIRIGEAGGNLDKVFVSLADYYESDANIKRKVKSALSYPTMLFFMTIAIIILMLAFVIPTFKETLLSLEIEPQGITLVIYGISDFILKWWYYIALSVVAVCGFGYLLLRTKAGKAVKDVFLVKCPFVRSVQTNLITARFARALCLLLESGMDMSTALDTTSVILSNGYIKTRFMAATEDVHRGVSLSNAFQKQSLFPPMLIQMISIGEQTASMEDVLKRSCVFFDGRLESSLASFTAKLQPLMLIIMGATVAILFVAVYSPMLSIMNGLS